MESLQGYFLIATPQMPDPRFSEALIYICAHNDEGTMGLIVNQPIPDVGLADIMESADIPVPENDLPPVYLGGPVESESAFFLYSSEYVAPHYLDVSESIYLTRDPQLLYDVSEGKGPDSYLVALGYAGWGPGQLENELTVDGWLTLPASTDIVFHTPDDAKWQKAAQLYGIDISLFGDVVGSA